VSNSSKNIFKVTDNDVSAIGQMKNSTDTYYIGDPNAKKRLLIVGNSITRHGPAPEVGWNYDFGMAASSADKDYVHILSSKLLEKEDVFIMVRQLSAWERGYVDGSFDDPLTEERDFSADEIIFRLGENVIPLKNEEEKARFKNALTALLSKINSKGGKIYFTTCFWRSASVDEVIRSVADELTMPVIELGDLGADEKYMAIGLFEHSGVAHHPGDLGMKEIACRLYKEMRG
jgi:hypothetical protein